MVLELTSESSAVQLEEEQAGYVISIPAFTYLIGCILLPYTCEHTSRKFLFFLACMGFAVCNFFLGPSKIFGWESGLDGMSKLCFSIGSLPF
jgi:predicted MFS family arabinose efflux permease